MIKKLGNADGKQMSSTFSGQRELIRQYRNKINEVIDELNKQTTCEGRYKGLEHPKCASCKYWGDNCGNHSENNTPQSEDWEKLAEDSLCWGDEIKATKKELFGFIRHNFVAKSEVEREMQEPVNDLYLSGKLDLFHKFCKIKSRLLGE